MSVQLSKQPCSLTYEVQYHVCVVATSKLIVKHTMNPQNCVNLPIPRVTSCRTAFWTSWLCGQNWL